MQKIFFSFHETETSSTVKKIKMFGCLVRLKRSHSHTDTLDVCVCVLLGVFNSSPGYQFRSCASPAAFISV